MSRYPSLISGPLGRSLRHTIRAGRAVGVPVVDRLVTGPDHRAEWRPARVHVVTSPVAQVLTANALLALDVVPSLSADPASIASFVATTDALVVNLGMLDSAREAAIGRGVAAARKQGRPWLLDPVKIEHDPARLALATALLLEQPAVVKANRAEIAALAGDGSADAAGRLARQHRCVVAVTGAADLVTDGRRVLHVGGGHLHLTRITAAGCAAGAVIGAFLGAGAAAFDAAALGLACFAAAGATAGRRAGGPGSFAVELLDALAALEAADLAAFAEISTDRVVDLRLYGVLDPARCHDRPLPELARAAAKGGITMLQLRDKSTDTRRLVAEAMAVREALRDVSVPLVVDDRVDVALAAEAEGAHVGRTDLAPRTARTLLGETAILGVTLHHGHEADEVPPGIADYAGLGPVFPTRSKDPGDPPLSPDGLRRLIGEVRRRHPDLPVCGIAGIDHTNAAAVIGAGADGVAVISDIFMAEDVEAAARRLRGVVDAALAQRSAR